MNIEWLILYVTAIISHFKSVSTGLTSQPSNGQKFNRQPSEKDNFHRQLSKEHLKISRQTVTGSFKSHYFSCSSRLLALKESFSGA